MNREFTQWRKPVAAWRRACKEIYTQAAPKHQLKSDTLPTLVACSGGADSAALAICLAASNLPNQLTLAYVNHGQRPKAETASEFDRVKELGDSLCVSETLNLNLTIPAGASEGEMRMARYASLTQAACELGIPLIATGHHANDQAETLLMRLARGTSLEGMKGIIPLRPVESETTTPIWICRPLIECTRADCEDACKVYGYEPVQDPTNSRLEFTRNAFRSRVVQEIESISPGAAPRIALAARTFTEAAALIDRLASEAMPPHANSWNRNQLRAQSAIILRTGVRNAFLTRSGGKYADSLSHATLQDIANAIADSEPNPRLFNLPAGMTLEVRAHEVHIWSSQDQASN